MKTLKILSLIFFTLISVNTLAQLKVNSSGNVGIGTSSIYYDLDVNSPDLGTRFSVGSGHKLIINKTAGECTLWSGQDYGYIGTSTYYWHKTYSRYIYRTYEYSLSDITVKDNVMQINNAMSIIEKLKGVSYDLNENAFNVDSLEKVNNLLKDGKNNLGFIAQDVEKILPQLVSIDDSTGLHYLNYEGIIPILVEAIKEQNLVIDTLKNEINVIKESLSMLEGNIENKKSAILEGEVYSSTELDVAVLFQNTPNPFNAATEIKYYIPEETNGAMLYVFNLQGTMMMTLDINSCGYGSSTINSSELQPGMYVYSLLVNGQEVDTKRMILTK